MTYNCVVPSRALISVIVGRHTHDADSRIARVILWLLANQRAILDGQGSKVTVNLKGDSIKPQLERYYGELTEGVA